MKVDCHTYISHENKDQQRFSNVQYVALCPYSCLQVCSSLETVNLSKKAINTEKFMIWQLAKMAPEYLISQ